MRKHKIICLMMVCLIVIVATAFAIATSDEAVVKSLIYERTDTLSGFYKGEIDRQEAIDKIKSIETAHLMEEDLRNIDLYFGTDIEQVKKYSIKDLKITESDEDIICANVSIEWQSEGIGGRETFVCNYSVICCKEENVYKLAQFFEGSV